MKILWIVNTIIPQIADACGLSCNTGGGWLSAFFDALAKNTEYDISICFPYNGRVISKNIDNVKYYSFKEKRPHKYEPDLECFFGDIISKERPHIVHIFGTEFPHTLSAVKACKSGGILEKCVISIQGLISACAKEYYAGLPKNAIYNCSLHDFLKADNVYFQKKRFEKRGEYEIEALKIAKNVIGRTEWDYNCVKDINKDINYFSCNESLRSEFYNTSMWNYEKCEKHSIFVPQSYYPLKGFHNLISIFAETVKKYPDTRIYTTGNCGNYHNFLLSLKHQTYYQKYILKLIKKFSLEKQIVFLGDLSAGQMRDRLLKSNVFLLSSSIENSSNSLGEAMLLGVPCISSDVGGISSLITHNKEGFLYPFCEPQTISLYIDKVFSDISLAKSISNNAITRAQITHSKEKNEKALKHIYKLLAKGEADT